MDIQEIIRQLRAGQSDRAIHQALGIHRDVVRKYRQWAAGQGLLVGEPPTLEVLHGLLASTLPPPRPPQNVSSVAPYREIVTQWRQEGVEIAAIHQRLQERGYRGS